MDGAVDRTNRSNESWFVEMFASFVGAHVPDKKPEKNKPVNDKPDEQATTSQIKPEQDKADEQADKKQTAKDKLNKLFSIILSLGYFLFLLCVDFIYLNLRVPIWFCDEIIHGVVLQYSCNWICKGYNVFRKCRGLMV